MHIPKHYFHDRLVLLLLSINSFIAILGSLMTLLRLDGSRGDNYIVQYRQNIGLLSAFKAGGSGTFLGFALFSIAVLIFHTVLSMRVYSVQRQFAVVILVLCLLLLVLILLVSNALLVQR